MIIIGIIRLVRPLKELISISRSHQPILLTVIAEEEVKDRNEPPAMSSTATIALLLSEVANSPPYFHNQKSVSFINSSKLFKFFTTLKVIFRIECSLINDSETLSYVAK